MAFLLAADTDQLKIPLIMLVVFGSAKLLAELFENFRQPGAAGEILAGVLIGPSVLGWIGPNSFLTALADLGVMFLLFRVGMEVKSSEFLRAGGMAAAVALSGVVLSFAMIAAILAIWGAPRMEVLFGAAAMASTSVGISAQVLAARGLVREKASQIILAAAVIDDVLGLLALAVVSNMARGKINVPEILLTTLLASAFVAIVAKWGSHAMKRLVPHLGVKTRLAEAEFVFAMCLLFALSLLAMYAGVAAIVGAFLAGMALGESVGERVHTLVHGTTELLVPFFLVGIGLRIDLTVLRHPSMAALALAILAAAVAAKLIGCGLGAVRIGRRDALRVAAGMIPRGEVTMVVAQLGLAMGAMTQPVYAVVVLMAVATTLIAPPLIKIAFAGANSAGKQILLHT